ncbi:hypothetical protein K469DRAFT_802536 [Zopfia rhizophila CBS 207.26]|uniref:Uncharacterized protein n=1 Tax=Zopfia rhizophila CBS 207.26 TaxID=1314779 RepID=A0A6A6DGT6_9PEZI|nr:hypothetical protein K469DRAFT_802536 [Zopfia rhizophila CBS 207.26]
MEKGSEFLQHAKGKGHPDTHVRHLVKKADYDRWYSSHGQQSLGRSRKMPKNSKNSKNIRKGNSFELLEESDGDESITVQTTSARGRPLKPTRPFEPNPPRRAKRANPTKAATSQPVPVPLGAGQWAQVEVLLTRVETALVAVEQRVEKT